MLAVALTGMALVGCTDEVKFGSAFIDKAPGGSFNLDSIFANPDYINQFLTNIYSKQYYGLPFNNNTGCNHMSPYTGKLDALTDLYQMHWSGQAVWSRYYTGTMSSKDAPLIAFGGEKTWETVHQVHLLMENIDRCETMDKKTRDYIIAQAMALKAYAYSVLLPHYGGLPIVNKTITGTNEEIGPRYTFEATVDSIVKWCDQAAPYLYWAYNGTDAESSSLQTGRWTKAGVMALKAQVLWLAASPLFNDDKPYYDGSSDAETQHLVWYGDYQKSRWTRALNAFEDFWSENEANGGYYHLYESAGKTYDEYRKAYRRGYILDDSPENIHWTKVSGNYGTQGTYCWLDWNNWSVKRLNLSPTAEYIEMFPWKDGKPFSYEKDMKEDREEYIEADKSKRKVYTCLTSGYDQLFYKWTVSARATKKEYNRDPRLYENSQLPGMPADMEWLTANGKAGGNIIETWVGGVEGGTGVINANGTVSEQLTSYCPTGFTAFKYVLTRNDYWRNYNMHWNVLTIPDMILMYAECLAESDRLTDAITQIDKIRERVGMKSINSTYNKDKNLTANKDNLIEEILRERACELGMTNARYIDMVRRKRTDWMVKPLHGMATYRMIKNAENKWVRRNSPWFGDDKDAGMEEPRRFEYEFFELIQGKRALWNKDPQSLEVKKWLMSPFPLDEINKNYGLIQNPGW